MSKKRRRQFARLYLRGDVWYARVRSSGGETTKRLAPRLLMLENGREVDKGRELAEQKVREWELEALRGNLFPDRVDLPRVPLSKFLPDLEKALKSEHGEETLGPEMHRLRVAAEYLGEPMAAVTPARVQEFLRHLERTREASKATRNRYRAALSTAWKEAIARGYAAENPALAVKALREDRKQPPRLSDQHLDGILSHARPILRPLFRLLVETGLRRGEALRLTWRDVDFDRGALMVGKSKGGSFREIPLSPGAVEALRSLDRGPAPLVGDAPVFPDITPEMATKGFAAAAEGAGIPEATLHHLRGTFLTRVLDRGAGLATARDLAGHSSVAVTNRYVSAATEEAKRQAVGAQAGGQAPRRRRKS